MAVIITVFKSQLAENPRLILKLAAHASEASELGEAFIYVPRAGQLMEFVNLLAQSGVNYSITSEGQAE